VIGVFSNMPDAVRALQDVGSLGVSSDNVHLIAGNDQGRHDEYLKRAKEEKTTTTAAAASSASFGGGVGIVASLVALAIPGVGPLIAGSAIATVLTGLGIGAAGGGLLGTFKNIGMSHEDAPLYEEAVRRGLIVLLAQIPEEQANEVRQVMDNHHGRDVRDQADTWRREGWSGPQADPHPFVSESSLRSHEMPEDAE